MARPRLQLHSLLRGITANVYFQPPANVQMEYPCIVYKRDSGRTQFADNSPYRYLKRYQLTVIDRDPDSVIPDQVAKLPSSSHDRTFQADDLNHDVFTLFF